MQSPLRLDSLINRRYWWYASGSLGFTLLERMLILYLPFFYLPPEELGMEPLLSTTTYLGVFTALGMAWLWGRVVDGLVDPVVAHLSDHHPSRWGRRKIFLLLSALPLALSGTLTFVPLSETNTGLNGLWLALTLGVFYVAFTAYVNPYLALLSEIGPRGNDRIDLATYMALFGLVGMMLVTMGLPVLVERLEDGGMSLRQAYQWVVGGLSGLALIFLYAPTRCFRERPVIPVLSRPSLWASVRETISFRPFRCFVLGEVCLQFAMNLLTLGLIYYAVIIFRRDPEFLTVLAGATMGVTLCSIPLVNRLAKRWGKKRVIVGGVWWLTVVTAGIFGLSQLPGGAPFYPALVLFGLGGVPLGVLIILVNPSIADLARAHALSTGVHREAMFFAARAVPLKLSIALAGVTFGYLLTLGKDLANPRGIHLSVLVVAVASFLAYLAFRVYPEEEVEALLAQDAGGAAPPPVPETLGATRALPSAPGAEAGRSLARGPGA